MSTYQTAETSYESMVTTEIQVRTNRTNSNNKLNIIIRNNEEGTYLVLFTPTHAPFHTTMYQSFKLY